MIAGMFAATHVPIDAFRDEAFTRAKRNMKQHRVYSPTAAPPMAVGRLLAGSPVGP